MRRVTRHHYACPLRWGDLDAQGHLNNVAYLDYLQEARVDFLLSGPPVLHDLLATGVLVVSHQVEYLQPAFFRPEPLQVTLWVDALGGSRFVVGYELHTDVLVARARTSAAPYDLATGTLRRLLTAERDALTTALAPAEPLRPVPRDRIGDRTHSYPVRVRWSDLDSYGHVNNVKYFDYLQEARIALMAATVSWSEGEIWAVVRQDLEYLRPLDFRTEPYAVRTSVLAVGTRSITLAVQIDDPGTGTTYATARTVLVGGRPITDDERTALSSYGR